MLDYFALNKNFEPSGEVYLTKLLLTKEQAGTFLTNIQKRLKKLRPVFKAMGQWTWRLSVSSELCQKDKEMDHGVWKSVWNLKELMVMRQFGPNAELMTRL